jgi:hypothetical protein
MRSCCQAEELARMFEDFASISDEELDVLCAVRT